MFCDAISQILHPTSTDGWMNAEVRTLKLLLLKQVTNMDTMRNIISTSKALEWPRIYSVLVHFAQYCVTLVIRLSCQKDYQCIRENEYEICVADSAYILHFQKKYVVAPGGVWISESVH